MKVHFYYGNNQCSTLVSSCIPSKGDRVVLRGMTYKVKRVTWWYLEPDSTYVEILLK